MWYFQTVGIRWNPAPADHVVTTCNKVRYCSLNFFLNLELLFSGIHKHWTKIVFLATHLSWCLVEWGWGRAHALSSVRKTLSKLLTWLMKLLILPRQFRENQRSWKFSRKWKSWEISRLFELKEPDSSDLEVNETCYNCDVIVGEGRKVKRWRQKQ